MRASGTALRFRLISCIIVVVLGLQVVALVGRPGKWGWPFTDYPMYAQSHQVGERIPSHHVVTGVTAEGQEIPITSEDVGVNLWVFERWAGALQRAAERQAVETASVATNSDGDDKGPPGEAVEDRQSWSPKQWLKSTWLFGMLKSKPDPDLAPLLLEYLQTRRELNLVALRVEDAAVALSRDGPVPAPSVVYEVKLPLDSNR